MMPVCLQGTEDEKGEKQYNQQLIHQCFYKTCVCLSVKVCAYMCVNVHVCTLCARECVYMCVNRCVHFYVCAYTCVCVCKAYKQK